MRGILPQGIVTVVAVQWHGTVALELTYKDASGGVGNELLFREDEGRLELVIRGDLQRCLVVCPDNLAELEQERQIAALPPAAICGALIVPAGLLARLRGEWASAPGLFARETGRVELMGMAAVMAAERALGHAPRDARAAYHTGEGCRVGYVRRPFTQEPDFNRTTRELRTCTNP